MSAFDAGQGSSLLSIFSFVGAKQPFNVGKHTLVAGYAVDTSFNPSSTDGINTAPLTFTVAKVDCSVVYNTSVSSTFIAGFLGTLKTFVRTNFYPNSPYSGSLLIQDVTDAANVINTGERRPCW